MADSRTREFRAMVVKISHNVDSDDLSKLKSLCKDFIGQRDLSRFEKVVQLFDALEQKLKLQPNDVSFLIHLLTTGCKNGPALVKLYITPYETKWLSAKNTSTDMQELATYLANKLGREYRRVLRTTGLTDNRIDLLRDDWPRDCREVIYRGFCECFRPPISASVETVIKALEDARLKTLAEEVSEKFL